MYTIGSGFLRDVQPLQSFYSRNVSKADLERTNIGSPIAEEILKQYSFKAFDRFTQVWKFDDFWKRANTCDASLCCMEAIISRWPEDPEVGRIQLKLQEMLSDNFDYFDQEDREKDWADDFGWWGLMGLNAYKFLKRIGDDILAKKYLALSTDSCWKYMYDNSCDQKPDSKPVPFGCKNCTVRSDGYSGTKNTVVNVLLLLLSIRNYRLYCEEGLPDRDKYLDMALRQWEWFSSWFELNQFKYPIPFKGDDTAALAPERPTAFFTGSDYQDLQHPTFTEGWIWSGDQGLLIGAFRELLSIKDDLAQYIQRSKPGKVFDRELFEKKVLQYIRKIGNGIQKALIGVNDGVIREAPFISNFGYTYGMDYLAGRGILVRYLGVKDMNDLVGIDFSSNIFATVDAIWAARDPSNNQCRPRFTDEDNDLAYIKQFETFMGRTDEVTEWTLDEGDMRDSVCQAIGMDFLRAAMLLQRPS